MSFGNALLIGWIFGFIGIIAAVFRSRTNNKAGAFRDLFLITILVILPLFSATFIWSLRLYRPIKALNAWNAPSIGRLYETHSFRGRPSVAIYMSGFPDPSFSAYLVDDMPPKLLFLTLPEMLSQFGYTTNSINRGNHAKRVCAFQNGVGMYDLFWSHDMQRFALSFKGHFIAAYDCKTGQKIQIREGLDNTYQCQALGIIIGHFLDGAHVTNAEVERIRRQAYLKSIQVFKEEKSN